MKRILLTGATGFIGAELCKKLLNINYEIGIIKRPTSNTKLIKSIYNNINPFDYDGSYKSIYNSIKVYKPKVIIHLASYQTYDHNYLEIDKIIESNIILGVHLIEAMKNLKVNYLINTGTYWQNYNNEIYNPVSLYAAGKQAFIDLVKYYTEKDFIKVITLKLFDTYGPNDPRKKIFYQINKAIINNQQLHMTPGEQMVNLVHIKDIVDAYAISIDRLLDNKGYPSYEEFNVRAPSDIKLIDLVKKYISITKLKVEINWGGKPYKDREIFSPYDKGDKLPGWNPKIRINDGLQEIAKE